MWSLRFSITLRTHYKWPFFNWSNENIFAICRKELLLGSPRVISLAFFFTCLCIDVPHSHLLLKLSHSVLTQLNWWVKEGAAACCHFLLFYNVRLWLVHFGHNSVGIHVLFSQHISNLICRGWHSILYLCINTKANLRRRELVFNNQSSNLSISIETTRDSLTQKECNERKTIKNILFIFLLGELSKIYMLLIVRSWRALI